MAGTSEWSVRPCEERDLDGVSALAAKLVAFHHELHPSRFLPSGERVRDGYRWWLGKELANARAAIVVAARGEAIGGYAYGRVEERDWMRLVDAHGKLHDVWVEPELRGTGLAERLVRACIAALEAKGAKQILLDTAWDNGRARRFFEKLGFAPSMIELVRPARDGTSSAEEE